MSNDREVRSGSDRDDLRVRADVGVSRGPRITLTFDGQALSAYTGESVAAALTAAGVRVLRTTSGTGEARGVFCGMGVCFDCLVIIDDQPSRRACMVAAEDGMDVCTQHGAGNPDGPGRPDRPGHPDRPLEQT